MRWSWYGRYGNHILCDIHSFHNLPEKFENRYAAAVAQLTEDQSQTTVLSEASETNSEVPNGETLNPDAPPFNPDTNNAPSQANTRSYARTARVVPMERLMEQFLRKELGVDVEVDAAHRTNSKILDENDDRPRLIHVRCLRRGDRDKILKAAPTKLRGRKFEGQAVFITDDVDPATREDHKKLVIKMKEMREEKRFFAFIPWSVPRVIR